MGYEDVRAMLSHARLGASIPVWRGEALAESRLLSGSRRVTQIRIAMEILRPSAGCIVDKAFLSDLSAADESNARDLIYGRYLASVPIAAEFARGFLRVGAKGTPVDSVSKISLDAFLSAKLPMCSEATRARTRTAIGSQFTAAGIARVTRDGALVRTTRRPAPIAVYHLLADELRERREASDAWLASHSLAAAIFSIDAFVFRDILESLIADHRLTRSYIGGEPRVLAA